MKQLRTLPATALGVMLSLLSWTAAHAQITPLGDSYTNTADPTTNYGAKTLLDVDGATQITYIQFNLSLIPSGANVTQATLKLYVDSVTTAGTFNVDYINAAWAESTIDASNAPTLGGTIASDVNVTTADKNQYILTDVTTAVQAWLSGSETNNGLALVANSTFNATFDSKESTSTSHAPELDIVFGGGTITGVTTASGSGLTGGGTSGTLSLGLTSACATNQVLQWNGTAWACASAGTGTITGVTAGTDLTGGGSSGNVTLNLNTTTLNSTYAQIGAANTFTGNQAITGNVTASGSITGQTGTFSATSSNPVESITQSGSGLGLYVDSPNAFTGVQSNAGAVAFYGNALDTGGNAIIANSSGGIGVTGNDNAASGSSVGVYGSSSSLNGVGVEGSGSYIGVYGQSTGTTTGAQPTGVFGTADGKSKEAAAVLGEGVWGSTGETLLPGSYAGVVGTADDNFAGMFYNNGSTPTIYAENDGPVGSLIFMAEGPDATDSCLIYSGGNITCGNFVAQSASEPVFQGTESGLTGDVTIGSAGCGSAYWGLQLAQTGMTNCNNYTLLGNGINTYINAGNGTTAGQIYFRINNDLSPSAMTITTTGSVTIPTLDVTTSLTKPAGSFKIDHPLDPANKYLYHSFVESPDMKNIYDGNVTTDSSGLATITLPDWFEALNKDFRYQLTVIGQFAQAIIARKIENNQFQIRTSLPNVEVSWQVTGIRQDAFANAHRIQTEVEKAPEDRGHYLHPELFGAPDTARIGYAEPVPPELPQDDSLAKRREQLQAEAAARRRMMHAPPAIPVVPKLPPAPKTPPVPAKPQIAEASK